MSQPVLLNVEAALEKVLAAFHPLPPETVPLLDSLGRVLAEEVTAKENLPPYANSAMDGYAVRATDVAGASAESPVLLRVIGEVAAGHMPTAKVAAGTAVRIMTGAPLPAGADAVVPVEETEAGENRVRVRQAVGPGMYVRPAGEDVQAGEVVLRRGQVVRPQEIGMLAALGRRVISVVRRPRVAILATGDEVVEIEALPEPGKIRNANSYSIAAQVLRYGGVPVMLGIAGDRIEELSAKIRAGLGQGVDLFLSSGGVSMGDFDLVREVLAAEGEMDFWRVRMKPGKPLAFGSIGGVPFLGLPGNPVSAMISFETFARPAILKMGGHNDLSRPTVEAILQDEIPHKDERRHYLRVRVKETKEGYRASLTGPQGSGILSSLVKANGLAIIPEEWREVPTGARVKVILLDRCL